MPTYVYETIPSQPGQAPRRFELKQSMKDAPLKLDPETGLPVKRVISGGFAFEVDDYRSFAVNLLERVCGVVSNRND